MLHFYPQQYTSLDGWRTCLRWVLQERQVPSKLTWRSSMNRWTQARICQRGPAWSGSSFGKMFLSSGTGELIIGCQEDAHMWSCYQPCCVLLEKGRRVRIACNSLYLVKVLLWYLWSKRRGIVWACVEIRLVRHLMGAWPRAFWPPGLCVVTLKLGVGPLWLCVGIATWFAAQCWPLVAPVHID